MGSIIVGVAPKRFRLPQKVGGPSHVLLPAPSIEYLTPAQKRRRLDAAYLERFFAREQRRLATGILEATERESIKIPAKGHLRPQVAEALGLVRNAAAKPGDPEATHWIPACSTANLQHSPFRGRPNASRGAWPHLGKPLLSPLKYRRLWFAARRQGLDHLLPLGPSGHAQRFVEREQKRLAALDSDSELLALAAQHWQGKTSTDSVHPVTAAGRDRVMRSFAIKLPKFARLRSGRQLFPYARHRLAQRRRKAQRILEAMEKMPQKIADYRKTLYADKRAARQNSPL